MSHMASVLLQRYKKILFYVNKNYKNLQKNIYLMAYIKDEHSKQSVHLFL